ncbi:MAG: hypothetical protein E6G33_15195 [Actinobacteria bacterium]|nr:MAG: hypothetical protein E6G33_15195 [Actinomycetota bacterium]
MFFAVGAALLALWVDVRFPRLGPPSMPRGFVLHVALVVLVCRVIVPTGLHATATIAPSVGLLGVFAIGLPGLVYVFLVGLWTLKVVHSVTGSHR